MKRRVPWVVSALTVFGLMIWLWQQGREASDSGSRSAAATGTLQETSPRKGGVEGAAAISTAEKVDWVGERDPLAGIYEHRNAGRDLVIVHNLLESYSILMKDPVDPYPRGGTNEDIVQAHLGKNRYKEKFLPEEHPALKEGRLVDRWGVPLHFHYASAKQVEIRSAGPDRVMGNVDDLVWE